MGMKSEFCHAASRPVSFTPPYVKKKQHKKTTYLPSNYMNTNLSLITFSPAFTCACIL